MTEMVCRPHVSGASRVHRDVHLPPFQALVDANAPALHRFLLGLVGADRADDCLQETLLSALRAYPGLRSGEDLRGWLYTIARRKAIDAVRRGRRLVVDGERVEAAAGSVNGHQPADDELWAAVRELPLRQRAAVMHRFVEDLSYREVAARMACTEEAARRSVHEGLKKLRTRIER